MSAEFTPTLKVMKVNPNAIIPSYANPGDAGLDLYSMIDGKIAPGYIKKIPLGIAVEIQKDWCMLFIGKSGLATKPGIAILGGLIDSGYRGELHAVLLNAGKERLVFEKGDKVTQGVLFYSPQARIIEVTELAESIRGAKGFGSTGKK
ncbi:MAG TPA: dUTP diphosphatase [Candidatus Saccharimonadales bacterium]|nr:dUTP diphosphatase [Candidatus Saccharimonadales bacterium]